ncbi:dentin sialophosphoprotein [Nasonia vitripennis]|uniref:Uncharacterized protein n=1 Tax=Nasonia vitripennis TaxID=7425 RepID=A0A7M7HBK6_NASVI|nr:dentin sialophosphoprotein [Nasonia vitripennis]XP_031782794.1 dentin sialophosphoprotein [Nasonia vitripennis]
MSVKKMKMKRARMSSEGSHSSSMSSSMSSSSSSDEETDAKDLKPIKEYLSNRKELAAQLFKSVKAEKIRMMLPQILKKVEFSDLEELCAAELTGMSKQRIISILNGQEMQGSSNTEDSDDSGPSLEIISDTEWLSEDETNVKVEGVKNNKNAKKLKKKSQDQKKADLKSKLKPKGKGSNVKIKTEKIKTEKKEKEKVKEKEGESLLDLLELEMRARAIRALIRKEESTPDSKATNAQSNNLTNNASGSETSNDAKSRQVSLKEQLEKIDVLMKHGEDEDVYVVINPAPTIELLSSESENEDGSKRVNKRLVSEREAKSQKNQENEQAEKAKNVNVNEDKVTTNGKDAIEENSLNKEKDKPVQEKKESKEKDKSANDKQTANQKENSNLPMSVTEENTCITSTNPSIPPEELEEGEIIDNDDEEPANEEKKIGDDSPSRRIIKKVKKNPNIRSRKANQENDDSDMESNKEKATEKERADSKKDKSSSKTVKPLVSEEPIEIEDSPTRTNETEKIVSSNVVNEDSNSKLDIFDDKALDIDEIINLDDYPDDMDDLERSQANQEKNESTKEADSSVKESDKVITKKTGSETWASRYYQQDDVQNVIKESKIQSEIRKRLRERQRQSKLNNSPKLKDPEESQSSEVVIPKPTGSVEEYLALKGISSGACSEIIEGKSDSVGSFKSLKTDDSQSGDNSTIVRDNFATNSDIITENKDDSSEIPTRVTEQPITIVKKPKLFEDIDFAKKVNSLLNENSSVEPVNSTPTCLERINLILSDKKIIIKEDEPLNNRKIILIKSPEKSDTQIQTTESGHDTTTAMDVETTAAIHDDSSANKEIVDNKRSKESTSSPLRHDVNTPKSDSSEDNVIVRIDGTLPQETLPAEEVAAQTEQTISNDLETSEFRPD